MPTTYESTVFHLTELYRQSPELAQKAIAEADAAVRRKCFRCKEPIYGIFQYTIDNDPEPSCENCCNAVIKPIPCTFFVQGGGGRAFRNYEPSEGQPR